MSLTSHQILQLEPINKLVKSCWVIIHKAYYILIRAHYYHIRLVKQRSGNGSNHLGFKTCWFKKLINLVQVKTCCGQNGLALK
ncbi:hypothetical protein Hanom_Chr11g01010561 [Helianthus anomalus]